MKDSIIKIAVVILAAIGAFYLLSRISDILLMVVAVIVGILVYKNWNKIKKMFNV